MENQNIAWALVAATGVITFNSGVLWCMLAPVVTSAPIVAVLASGIVATVAARRIVD